MNQNRLPKNERLSGLRRIDGLFSRGRGGFVYPFRYVFTEVGADADRDGEPAAEEQSQATAGGKGIAVLVSVSKRYHKRANKRNLLKRRTREAFRMGNHQLREKAEVGGKQVDIALIYSTKEIVEFNTISNAVGKILSEIAQRI